IKSYISEVEDPQKKELAVSYEGACKKIFGVASRKRRDHHHGHKLDDYLKTHLSWLTTEQAETLKQMKTENKSPEEMQKKVFEFYDATTGETRVKATELLQGGCRDLIQTIVGQEKATELKNMRESGASVDAMNAKVKEFVGQINDEEKKQLATKYEGACRKVFGVQSRKRREHHHDEDEDLEKFAQNHLTWLTDEQRQQVTALKDAGKDAIKAKIHEFYNAATGDTKAKATLELQTACQELINKVIGEEHAAILKGLRDSGADIGEIQKKTDEFLAQVPDEKKRKLAEDHREGCAQMFLTPPSRRLRRDKHHEHTLKEFVENHLTWLNAEQKAQILELDGQKEAVKAKINEFFEKTSGDEREKATASFQAACRERLVHVLGDQKAAELKAMRESGASNEA
uniref:Polyprotein allergen nematode domain-containing protein n=1 Tax=Panagrolaimus sp. ES5 TaxID=591445 RepID=A0AC34GDM6_9BILA